MSFTLRPIAATCALFTCAAACAQTTPAAQLDPVVVTATRIAQPISDVLSDLSLVDAQTFTNQTQTSAGEWLQTLSGVEGQLTSDKVFIRGAEARMTAVYVDGIRIDQQDGYTTGGGAPWSLIPLQASTHVELLRGPASGLYGSDAMGGVIQVFTRDGRDGEHRSVFVGAGNHGSTSVGAAIAGRAGAFDYALSMGTDASDGYNTKPDTAHTPETEGWDQTQTSIKLGYTLNDAHHVGFTQLQRQRSWQYVNWNGGANAQADSTLNAGALKWDAQWHPQWQMQAQVSQSRIDTTESTPKDFTTLLSAFSLNNVINTTWGDGSFGGEWRYDTLDAAADGWGNTAQEGQRRQQAVYAGWGKRLGDHLLQANIRRDLTGSGDGHNTWGLQYAYELSPEWRAQLGSTTGYRLPTLSELYDPAYGDSRLQAETSRTVESSLRFRAGGTQAKASVYQTRFDQLISTRAPTDPCPFCWYNVGHATVRGVSLEASTAVGSATVGAAYDLLSAHNDDNGNRLNYRSPRKLAAFVTTSWMDWQWRANWLVKSGRWDNASNTQWLPGYSVVNLSAQHTLDNDTQVRVHIDNVFDRQVEEVKGLASPGRRIMATLVWTTP